MVSKLMQKEKERQKVLLNIQSGARTTDCPIVNTQICMRIAEHKQSLINLKEYIEELVNKLEKMGGCTNSDWAWKIESEDIRELSKIIKRYE